MDFAAVVLRVRAGHRVARHGHQSDVAGIDETRRQHRQRRFAADAVIDFRGRIKLYVELAGHETGDGLAERRDAVVGVTPVFRPVNLVGHCLADRRRGHLVVLADAEIQQFSLGMLGNRLALGPFDLLELIDFASLAVLGAANSFGEQLLKIWIAHVSNSNILTRPTEHEFIRWHRRLVYPRNKDTGEQSANATQTQGSRIPQPTSGDKALQGLAWPRRLSARRCADDSPK